jgi:hypothetical protein
MASVREPTSSFLTRFPTWNLLVFSLMLGAEAMVRLRCPTEGDGVVCTPARHDMDLHLSGEGLDAAVEAAQAGCVGGEVTAVVVADVDLEVFSVAVPLGANSADVGLFHRGQYQSADDGPCSVGDFARECPSVQRRFNELNVDATEA